MARRNRINGTASLDRIDSSKGYVPGNIQCVHKDINALKTDFSEERFLELIHMIAAHDQVKRHLPQKVPHGH